MKTILLFLVCLFIFIRCSTSDNEVIDATVPTTPTSLISEVISKSEITLKWTDNSTNERGFKIERKNENGIFELVSSVGANITSFKDTGLKKATSYSYKVYSYNSAGPSPTYTNVTTQTTKLSYLQIGSTFQGGILVYVLNPGDTGYDENVNVDHGIISMPEKLTYSNNTIINDIIIWHSTNTGATGATGRNVGSGKTNTDKIIALYGNEYNAARICHDLVYGGYNDWFLPSAMEMYYVQRHANVVTTQSMNDDFWTSTESTDNSAELLYFDGVSSFRFSPKSKNTLHHVVATRYF
jgi:hypothetical protein